LFLTFSLFTVTAPTELYTLSLHDALPIFQHGSDHCLFGVKFHSGISVFDLLHDIGYRCSTRAKNLLELPVFTFFHHLIDGYQSLDRKSTRLNSSHVKISYAVFCLKKKKLT